jgi:hypothetical protein
MTPATTKTRVETPTLTRDQLFNRIQAETKMPTRKVTALMRMFRDAAADIDLEAETAGYILVDMSAHNLLDLVMPDMAAASPGTIHAAADRTFLPEGWTFRHDLHVSCTLQAIKR